MFSSFNNAAPCLSKRTGGISFVKAVIEDFAKSVFLV